VCLCVCVFVCVCGHARLCGRQEVTEMQRSVKGEVVSSTFDEHPSRHVQVGPAFGGGGRVRGDGFVVTSLTV